MLGLRCSKKGTGCLGDEAAGYGGLLQRERRALSPQWLGMFSNRRNPIFAEPTKSPIEMKCERLSCMIQR